jgi:gluconokinase
MFLIVMGVSGCGKSTIASILAEKLGWKYFDGDSFHSAANIAKMSRGIPLNDEDRADWLAAMADMIRNSIQNSESGILACSALKQKYRDQLCVDQSQVKFVYLKGSYDAIKMRMESRPGHYMKPGMLDSQFADLQEPVDAIIVDIQQSPKEIVTEIIRQLSLN